MTIFLRPKSEAPERRTGGGCGGGGSPPATNEFLPAEEFQAASRGSGGAEPGWVGGPGTIIQNHNYIITTVFYNLQYLDNLNNIINIIFFTTLIRRAGRPACIQNSKLFKLFKLFKLLKLFKLFKLNNNGSW